MHLLKVTSYTISEIWLPLMEACLVFQRPCLLIMHAGSTKHRHRCGNTSYIFNHCALHARFIHVHVHENTHRTFTSSRQGVMEVDRPSLPPNLHSLTSILLTSQLSFILSSVFFSWFDFIKLKMCDAHSSHGKQWSVGKLRWWWWWRLSTNMNEVHSWG